MNELYEWNEPVNEWSSNLIRDYCIWVKDSYGMDEATKLFKYAREYRAIKDVMRVKEEPPMYGFGWTDPRGVFGS